MGQNRLFRYFLCAMAISAVFFSTAQEVSEPVSSGAAGLSGIWENPTRFVALSPEGSARIILKTYYGFVFDNAFSASWTASTGDFPSIYNLEIRYPGERESGKIPVAIIDDFFYLRFYRRFLNESSAPAEAALAGLSGLWLPGGTGTDILIYRREVPESFHAFYFTESEYFRIRYWKTDARPRELNARFQDSSSLEHGVPKFMTVSGTLYTCVTGGSTILRNYERGRYSYTDGKLKLEPSDAETSSPPFLEDILDLTFSEDGMVFAVGRPAYQRSAVTDLDAAIAAHNSLRRPPRKPLIEFMDLDFRWDDIERIRNKK